MTQRRLFVGLECYSPRKPDQEMNLRRGEWVPWFEQNGDLVDASLVLPRLHSANSIPDSALDPLENPFGHPIICKKLNMTWLPSYNIPQGDYSFLSLSIMVNGPQRSFRLSDEILRAPPNNVAGKLQGTQSAALPYILRFARPIRVDPGRSIFSEVAAVDSEAEYSFGQAAAANKIEAVYFGRGRETGNAYRFGTSGVDEEVLRRTYQNEYEEPVDIQEMALYSPTASSKRALFNVSTGQDKWMRSERLYWLFADPFPYARLDFGFLPEGGMVLYPGEGFSISVSANAN